MFDFYLFLRFLCKWKHILNHCRSPFCLGQWKKTIYFILYSNGFHGFENNCFPKIHLFFLILPIFLFYLSTFYIITLMTGLISHFGNHRRRNQIYFDWQLMALLLRRRFLASSNWIFNVFSICCYFCKCKKIKYMQVPMPFYIGIGGNNGFRYFEINCFWKYQLNI